MQKLRATSMDDAFINLGEKAVMSVQFEVRVAGRLDVDRLAGALRVAVGRHPLSRARLGASGIAAAVREWHVDDAPGHLSLEVTDEPADAVRARLQSVAPDLDRGPAFLVSLVREDGGDRLMFNCHHAAFDGMSAVRFITSIARAYAEVDDDLGGPPIEEARDLRGLIGARSVAELMPRVRKVAKDVTMRRSITRIAPVGGVATGPRFAFAERRLDAAVVAAARASRPEGATVNDLALAAHALSVIRWNREHGKKLGDYVSIMMPVNLRPAAWSGEVVSNFASYLAIFVPTDVSDLRSATEVVRDETAPVKANGAAGWMVDLLEPGQVVPAVLRRQLQTLLPLVEKQFVETTVLSNLGALSMPDFGAAGAVTEVWFTPPVMSASIPIAVGVAGVGGSLFVGLRGNRRVIGPQAIDHFADLYVDVLTGR